MRKLVYYVGMSIDGRIAGPGGEFDFFPVGEDVMAFIVGDYPETLPTHVREQLGVDAPNRHFDIGIMGRGTYDPGLRMGVTRPYAHLREYVVSRRLDRSPDPEVTVVAEDPVATVRELKAQDGKDLWLMGGGQLAGALLDEVDELVVKLYPVVAGDGVPLFTAEFSPTRFTLTGNRALEGGTVVLTYERKRDPAPAGG